MSDSTDNVGTAVAVVLAFAVLLLLMAGAGAVFVWQRQAVVRQEALVERERALAEEARARALAEQRLAQAAQEDHAASSSPGGIDGGIDVDPPSVEAAIRRILEAQQRAWNGGDIDEFMEYYWKSDGLTFSSGGKVTRTWQGTLENYKERYPSPAEMGQLSFQNLEVTPLGAEAALVLGEWQLRRESDTLGGNFTLVFRRLGDKWVIVHDHTSRAEQP